MRPLSLRLDFSNPCQKDGNIQVTDELLTLHRFGNSPFTDELIQLKVADWTKTKRKNLYKSSISTIYVEWNGSDSYHQAFSNAQVVAKASVEK